MAVLALGLGLVLAIEGLAFALAPSRMEDLVVAIARIPPATRRLIGLIMLAAGIGLVALARAAGAL